MPPRRTTTRSSCSWPPAAPSGPCLTPGRSARRASGEPLLLIAHPGNNSLPAALEVLARLQQDGTPGRIVYLQGPDDQSGSPRSPRRRTTARRGGRCSARASVSWDRPSDWLVASTPEAATVRKVWGPTVVPLDMEEGAVRLTRRLRSRGRGPGLRSRGRSSRGSRALDLRSRGSGSRLPSRSSSCGRPRARRDHRALLRPRLHARTHRLLRPRPAHRRGRHRRLRGRPGEHRGLLWARTLARRDAVDANPAQVDAGADTLWLAHCTVPRSLVTGYRLRSHFESGFGVGIQGELPRGPATVLRIAAGRWTGCGSPRARSRARAGRGPLPHPGPGSADGRRASPTCCVRRSATTVLVPGHHSIGSRAGAGVRDQRASRPHSAPVPRLFVTTTREGEL